MEKSITSPNVIYAGIQRTGSTWLYSCFKDNPQIYVPYVKEIHYFDNNYQRGPKWYSDFFRKSSNEKIRIDITPNYFHDPSIPGKIKALIPDCKIIIIFRNPVDFLYSLYNHHRQTLRVKTSFRDMIDQEEYLGQALFSEKLKGYLECFPRDQIYIGYYEEFSLDNQNYLSDIYKFLQVEEHHPTITNKVINAPVEARYRGLHQIMRKIRNISRQNKTMYNITNHFRQYILHSRWYSKPQDKTILMKTEEREFLESFYSTDVKDLSEIVDKDLTRYWGFSKAL